MSNLYDPMRLLAVCDSSIANVKAVRDDNRARALAEYAPRLAAWEALTPKERASRNHTKPRRETVPNRIAEVSFVCWDCTLRAFDAHRLAEVLREVMGTRSVRLTPYLRATRAKPRKGLYVHRSDDVITVGWATGRIRLQSVPCQIGDGCLDDADLASQGVAA